MKPICRCWLWGVLATVLTWGWAARVCAQGIDPAGRPIAQIQIQGLEQVPEQLVRNQIRLRPGDPYDPQTVEQDIVRITHLGRFSQVRAQVQPQPDGSVILIYLVHEQPLLADVQVVGNKAISDQDLLSRVLLRAGDPADPFLIEQGVQQIRRAYEEKGYFVVDVTPDQELMQESGILIYRIREGPKVRIRAIQFEGNQAYSEAELRSKIRSKTYIPILRQGELNREQLELDAARVRDFYRDRGYLDAEVYRRIDLSPDQRSAVVTFVVEEGPQYLVQSIRVEGAQLFPVEQILRTMELRQGGIYSAQQVQQSINAIRDLYGQLGFLDTSVQIHPLFHQDQPRVDVVVSVEEGRPSLVGKVAVRGNDVTKDKVILRQVRGMTPGRPFDRTGLDKTRQRLMESPLFSESTVTVLGEPGDPVRDVLIQVEEQTTGSLTFGAGVSSDAGIIGAIDLVQRNFDIADVPESVGEFFTGKAFRGAGQYFALTIQPGSEISRYAVNFREPYLLESDYFLDTQLFFYTRELESYDEQRMGGAVGLGQRFGDVWSASVRARATEVELSELEPSVPVDVLAVEGASLVTGLGFVLERNTTDSVLFPTKGSAWELAIERVGALGGDFDFTRLTTSLKQFWTVDEDFFGRRTVLSWRIELGYIFEEDEAPVFERFYAGGHRSFRGFKYRGVGPRGIRADTGELGDDPVGGDWLLLTGLEYQFPLLGLPNPGEHTGLLNGVVFTDMGTVQDDVGLDEWRVSVGAGLRLKIPFLGQAPFALDFAIPVLRQDGDEEQFFSFDLALPLR